MQMVLELMLLLFNPPPPEVVELVSVVASAVEDPCTPPFP